MPVTDVKAACSGLRTAIKDTAATVLELARGELPIRGGGDADSSDWAEVRANAMLAYRHLEDARMRLGKVLQAYDGGTSVYDK